MPSESSFPPLAGGHRRYLSAFLCLCVTTICYADRANIGVALPSIVASREDQGVVLAAFFYGYLLTQTAGGYLATKLGAKWVLIGGVVVWTFFDLSTLVAAGHLEWLYLSRALMGVGEGILFPCMHQIAGAWYPIQERSQLVSIVASGIDLGTIASLVFAPIILENKGWQWIFGVFGVLSFIWVAVFIIFGSSRPEDDPKISDEEFEFIVRNRTLDPVTHRDQHNSAEVETESMNWHVLLKSRPAWAIYVAHICSNYAWYVMLGWSPQYFQQVLKIDMGKNSLVAALPYIAGYAGTVICGRVGDTLVTRGVRELHVRQGINAFSFLGFALFLYLLRFANSVGMALVIMSLALFCYRCLNAGFWVNMIDIAPNHAAHVMGVSNTLATIPGIVGNVVTGKILEATGDWNAVFGIAAAVLVVGAVVFHVNSSDESIYKKKFALSKNGYSSGASTIDSPEAGLLSSSTHNRQNVQTYA